MMDRQGGAQEQRAPFDDTRAALRFALNAHQVSPPSPYMNRVLASVPPKEERRKRPTRSEREIMHAVGAQTLDELRSLLRGKRVRGQSLMRRPPRPTIGLDGAHLAGFILRELAKLDDVHQVVLTGLMTNPVTACTCASPCCSGWRPVQRWVDAVDQTCELLKTRALVEANPGWPAVAPARVKTGLSTQPALRRTLVKEFYCGDRRRELVELGRLHGLSDETVARHRGWAYAWLEEQEVKAWEAVSWWFDQVGITGPWLWGVDDSAPSA